VERLLRPAAVALLVVSIVTAWAFVAWREGHWERYAPRTPFLDRAAFDRLDCPALAPPRFGHPMWVPDAAMGAWPDVPRHLSGAPPDRTAIDYEVTPRGTLVWIPFLTEGPAPDGGRRYWVARVNGSLETSRLPTPFALNTDIVAYSLVFGALPDGFYAALDTRGGTLLKLDDDLAIVASRTEAGPRVAAMPALNYFAPDGRGGLFYASYQDDGVGVHHVASDLRDVVPPRMFGHVRHGRGEHVNPHAAGHAPGRHCFELACFVEGRPNQPCASTYLAVDDQLEPIATLPIPRPADRLHRASRLLTWICALGAAAALGITVLLALRWRRLARALATDAVDAHLARSADGEIVLRLAEGGIALARLKVRTVGAMELDGPCVVASASTAMSRRREAYRGSAGVLGPGARATLVAGTREGATRLVASRRRRAAVLSLGAAAAATALGGLLSAFFS
jgi:hypothetical protein